MKKWIVFLFIILLAAIAVIVLRKSKYATAVDDLSALAKSGLKSGYGAAVDELAPRVKSSETADPGTYTKLFAEDGKRSGFLVNEAVKCVVHENDFPFTSHTFLSGDTQRIIEVLNDSSNYQWGEIGTPHYDKCILFYDKAGRLAGCINVSFDGEIDMFPYRAVIKWGLLSDKGFKQLMTAIRTK